MGWFDWAGFGSDSSTSLKPARSSDGGFIAPDRHARATCWQGRDKFFACLDQHDILDSVKEDGKARQLCGAELREFEKVCAKTWVCVMCCRGGCRGLC